MTPADGEAQRFAISGWTLARVEGVSFGEGTTGGWRATKGAYMRGGARLESVVEQVEEHERWAARQTRPFTQLPLWPERRAA